MIYLVFLPGAVLLYGMVFYAAWTGRVWTKGSVWNPKISHYKTEPFSYWLAVGAYIVLGTVFLMVSLHDLFGDNTAR